MAGLNLRGSLGVTAALPPSAATVGQLAYGSGGQSGSDSNAGPAGMGSVGVTVAATAVLAWLWWSLPR